MELKITNSLTRKKEIFVPKEKNHAKIYVCGVTPYDYSHIGHGRCYVNFDVLVRLLNFIDYKVSYIRNLTDIDDKILNRAQEELQDKMQYKKIAEKYIKYYQEDMSSLNCLKPTVEPRVTENIDQIICFIQELIDKKHAYPIEEDIYFSVLSFKEYGKLSGKNLEDLLAGARVEVDSRKKHPADFVLWKGNKENLFWKTPWGYGRPGWHIECSVMAKRYLGNTIDIHGGGMDLIFPHHENEIAQTESLTGHEFAAYWMHNAFININKEKMSKSLGNFFTLRAVFEKFNPIVLRYFFLQHNYRTPIEFNLHDLQAAQVAYKKLIKNFENIKIKNLNLEEIENTSILKDMLLCLCDDLNSPKLLGILFENLNKIKESEELTILVKSFINKTLGLTFNQISEEEAKITPEIENLIKQREEARKNKDWILADKIRDQLQKIGYQIQDKKI